jgi:hypothetical protein
MACRVAESCCESWLATGDMRSLQCVGDEFPTSELITIS